ncbi:MAG: hypothetical protein AAF846_24985 [Chloroflexota bacterium]
MQERISDIQRKYVDELMQKKNVVGVGIGLAKENDEYTDEVVLVVMVEKKVDWRELDDTDVIPSEIEGVRVDVQETGQLTTY